MYWRIVFFRVIILSIIALYAMGTFWSKLTKQWRWWKTSKLPQWSPDPSDNAIELRFSRCKVSCEIRMLYPLTISIEIRTHFMKLTMLCVVKYDECGLSYLWVDAARPDQFQDPDCPYTVGIERQVDAEVAYSLQQRSLPSLELQNFFRSTSKHRNYDGLVQWTYSNLRFQYCELQAAADLDGSLSSALAM